MSKHSRQNTVCRVGHEVASGAGTSLADAHSVERSVRAASLLGRGDGAGLNTR